MEINKWINKSLPDIVNMLEKNIVGDIHVQTEEGLNISGRTSIYNVLDDLLAVLFPGAYSKEKINSKELNYFIGNKLRFVSLELKNIIHNIMDYYCKKDKCEECNCDIESFNICAGLIENLPYIRAVLLTDIKAAFDGDPAAQSMDEIILSYPSVEAIATYRIAHFLYKKGVPIIPRIMTERAHSNTGIDINPGAKIESGFFIDHGTGVVIGETCSIGKNVKLYQGVTLGALSPFDKSGLPLKGKKRHPDIEDDVIIYANATILGGKTVIGKGAVVAGNTWITRSVPPGDIAYSNN